MRIKKLSERQVCVNHSYDLNWYDVNQPSCGWGPDCDKDGNPLWDKMGATAKEYAKSFFDADGKPIQEVHIWGTVYKYGGIRDWSNRYVEPATGRCVCGQVVTLDGFTNTCEHCERDYNMEGVLLAPRSQWGWETGETADEIMRPFRDPENMCD